MGGAGLAAYAYLPQIAHVVRRRCSSGLSGRAFVLWFLASLLMTAHAVTIGATVFVILGIQQGVATGVLAVCCHLYRDRICGSHQPAPPRRRPARGRRRRPPSGGHGAGSRATGVLVIGRLRDTAGGSRCRGARERGHAGSG